MYAGFVESMKVRKTSQPLDALGSDLSRLMPTRIIQQYIPVSKPFQNRFDTFHPVEVETYRVSK